MEVKKLTAFVLLLVFVGMLLGVGVLILDKYSRAVRTTTTVTDGLVNVSSGAATLSQTYCLTIASVVNTTDGDSYSTSTYNVTYSNPDTCVISADLPNYQKYNITFTYGAASAANSVADDANSAITPIGTTWMALIVTVFILAIILTMVIGSFGAR
jgi:hypothetical protein